MVTLVKIQLSLCNKSYIFGENSAIENEDICIGDYKKKGSQ